MGLHGSGIWGMSSANCEGAKRIKCPNCGAIFYWGSHNQHSFYPKDNTVYCPKNNKIQSLHKDKIERSTAMDSDIRRAMKEMNVDEEIKK